MEIVLPRLITVHDYHEIDPIEEFLNDLSPSNEKGVRLDIKLAEVGFSPSYRQYIALIYHGRYPKRSIIKNLVNENLPVKDYDFSDIEWVWENK